MRQLVLTFVGICSLTMAAGCCCWSNPCSPCGSSPCSTGNCGPGGCGVQQYGQPYNTGYMAPTTVQQAYAPLQPIPMTAVGPVESLPTYR